MNWLELLHFQQQDFIKRLSNKNLLKGNEPSCHGESFLISGHDLNRLRNFCWEITEKYKRNSQVKKTFINNLKGKLGEEVVKKCLGELVTEVDYEIKWRGDGKVDFTLTSDPSIGIQVKTCSRKRNKQVAWSISLEELKLNKVIACILIEEEVTEAETEYHLVFAGFLPTFYLLNNDTKVRKNSIKLDDLLYSSGLSWFLLNCDYLESTKESGDEMFPTTDKNNAFRIQVGSLSLELTEEQLKLLDESLETHFHKRNTSLINEGKKLQSSPFAGKTPASDEYCKHGEQYLRKVIDKLSCNPSVKEELIKNIRFIDIQKKVFSKTKEIRLRIGVGGSGIEFRTFLLINLVDSRFLADSHWGYSAHIRKISENFNQDDSSLFGGVFSYSFLFKEHEEDQMKSDFDKNLESLEKSFFSVLDKSPKSDFLADVWDDAVKLIKPMGTRALFQQQAILLALDQRYVYLTWKSRGLKNMFLAKRANFSQAFSAVLNRDVIAVFLDLNHYQ